MRARRRARNCSRRAWLGLTVRLRQVALQEHPFAIALDSDGRQHAVESKAVSRRVAEDDGDVSLERGRSAARGVASTLVTVA